MGGTTPTSPPGSDSSLSDEFSKATLGPFTSPRWSDLPIDILLSILQCLELPQARAFASVCTTWRAATTAAGVPLSSTPWIMSWGNYLEEIQLCDRGSSAVTCNLYHPVAVDRSYGVSFPKGCFVTCFGASHGWLILANNLSNLVLYNPVTLAMITLPPVTDFACVEAIYGIGGNLEHYGLGTSGARYEANCLGIWFYQKAVLSCSPSKGQSKWQVASTLIGRDMYLDCVYHKGRFYAVTLHEMVEKWDLDGANGPTREVVVAAREGPPGCILARHLVSTPWGDLLQVRAVLAVGYPDGIAFKVYKVDPDAFKMVVQENLVGVVIPKWDH
ncbi:hypothetical protein E2562_016936 [Oryza meyeriana var. granulata]|uniref:Uncharacterized protein n=1 Tax=Oryza meyeriana var. granulata TaxID=110450 RepID=A0A6G1DWA9_9ORYZ|nr:hypothetical protein E2562_016936 [Oryza meyeriana var. granulata]